MTVIPRLREVARSNLCRTAPFTLRSDDERADDEDDGQTIDGYAAVYGRDLASGEEPSQSAGWALIDSWEGTFWERFRFPSFRKSIRERVPRMQFDHGRHPLLGSLPLGRWTDVTEDAALGLHTVGRLSDNWLVEPFRDAIRDRAVDGMSIRFEVVDDEWRDVDGKLITKEDDLLQLLYRPDERGPLRRTVRVAKLPEAGPVTWPAYQSTSVGVRSVTIDLGRLRDPAQRSLLARAVYLADATTEDDPSPRATDRNGPAGDHEDRTKSTDGTPQPTDTTTSAGEHESRKSDSPRDEIDAWLSRSTDEQDAQVRAALALTFQGEL
jgi:phage head maturation protease